MKMVLATANPDKALEIAQVLGDWELMPRPAEVPEVEETEDTLEGNARLKARALCKATGLPALADDTGLEVDLLGGAPGVYSARWSGEGATYASNVTKMLSEMEGQQNRRARFRTVIVVAYPDGSEVMTEGVVEGTVATEARGHNGFGYDPVFVPEAGNGLTYAEMDLETKNSLSHRGQALRTLADKLSG
jgi:XTP/dITP diphosphohydrolase